MILYMYAYIYIYIQCVYIYGIPNLIRKAPAQKAHRWNFEESQESRKCPCGSLVGFFWACRLLAFGRLVGVLVGPVSLVGLVGLVALWLRTVKILEKPEVLGPNLAKTMCFLSILLRLRIQKRLKLEKPDVSRMFDVQMLPKPYVFYRFCCF